MPNPCDGGVPGQTAVVFPDTFQPCPASAVWICDQTEARYCGAHRQEVELIDHRVTFRPVDGEVARLIESAVERWNKGEAALNEEIAWNAALKDEEVPRS